MDNVTIFKDGTGYFYFDSRGPVFFAIAKKAEADAFIARGAVLLWAEHSTVANAAASCGITI